VALTFLAVFQLARMLTPSGLGFLVQRPESRAIHHPRGVHAHNCADLPLGGIVFSTFRNPGRDAPQPLHGFYDGASARVAEMLAFRDVGRRKRPFSDELTCSVDGLRGKGLRCAPTGRCASSDGFQAMNPPY
jgi:hypothetical protein